MLRSQLFRSPILRTFTLFVSYLLICWSVRLVFISLVTYFFIKNHSPIQDIGEVVQSNAVFLFGFSAVLFLTLMQFLKPITTTDWKTLFHVDRFYEKLFAGLSRGLVFGFSFLLGTTFGGHHQYLGFSFHLNELLLTIISIFFLTASFFFMTLTEEYILRVRVEPILFKLSGSLAANPVFQKVWATFFSTLFFLAIKNFQFEMSWTENVNFIFLNVLLSTFWLQTFRNYPSSAGFLSGFLIVFHSISSLPLFGQDISGLILFRALDDQGISSVLSGGLRGPEDSPIFFILLVSYLLFHIFREYSSRR